jgi:preprotein translocase SecE subunit
MERKRIVSLGLLVGAVIIYMVGAQVFELLFDALSWPVTRDYFLTLPEMASAVLAVGVFAAAMLSAGFVGFLNEAVTELGKVTYPTPKESGQSAVIVVGIVTVATIVLTFFDSIWTVMTRYLLAN